MTHERLEEIRKRWIDVSVTADGKFVQRRGAFAADVLPELLAEIDRLRALVEWRPIETAPKDGTSILIIDKDRIIHVSHLADIAVWTDELSEYVLYPTHWLPFPKPPEVIG